MNEDLQYRLVGQHRWPDVSGASFTVVGLGKSGVAAANALVTRGAEVLAVDDAPADKLVDSLKALDPRVQTSVGGGPIGRRGDLFVVSPGLMPHSPRFREMTALAAEVISEIELFWRIDCGRHPIVAISGTDGKTTTTLWTAHLLRQGGRNVVIGGNIGDPLCGFLDGLDRNDVVVAEVSAFQLHTSPTFRPRAAAVTNIAADHLDWFAGNMAAYVRAKVQFGLQQGPGDTLVMNGDDPELQPWHAELRDRPADLQPFSTRSIPPRGWGFDGTTLWLAVAPGEHVPLVTAHELGRAGKHPITGVHNVENALAASGLAWALGTPLEAIRAGLRNFSLPSHRLEPAGQIGGVRFVDDSKATNPHAAMAGLEATTVAAGEKLVWIGGGSEKDADFAELGQLVGGKAHAAVLIGQTAERIATCLPSTLAVERCPSMEDAVARAWQLAQPAGVVLLSPACASFDMFKGYAHRGEVFAQAVDRLAEVVAKRA
jgi:UDP-N-acetylmuramoylalanine--D-glutamate ligase